MQTQIIDSKRFFQLWSYTASHSELLFRSTKSAEFPTRIEVFFKGVEQFHLPTTCDGLLISEASDEDISKLCSLRPSSSFGKDVKVFTVRGAGFAGYITALIALVHEDDCEYNDASFFAKKK